MYQIAYKILLFNWVLILILEFLKDKAKRKLYYNVVLLSD